MNHIVLRLVFLIPLSFILLNGTSCKTGNHQADSLDQARFSISDLQSDLKQLWNFLEKSHPRLYQFTSKEDFDRLFQAQYDKIRQPMTAQEFYPILIPLVAKVGCGHTSLWSPDNFWVQAPDRMFPLAVHAMDGKLYVLKAYNPDLKVQGGQQIVSVNGLKVSNSLSEMLERIWSDGFIKTKRYQRLNDVFPYLYALNYGFPESFLLELKDGDKTHTIKLEPGNRQQIVAYRTKITGYKQDLELQDLGNSTALLSIRTFGYYDNVKGFHHFLDSSFSWISENQIENLIIDLRGNDGGDPFCSTHLVRYLQNEPIVYFSQPYGRYAAFNKPLPPINNRFEGKQFYLIDGMCFSTTGHLTSLLKYHKLGTFVGEETGATYTCNDASHDVRLKHTGYRVQSARRSFATAVTGFPLDQGILPDFPVCPGIEDIVNDRDAVLEYTLQLISSKK